MTAPRARIVKPIAIGLFGELLRAYSCDQKEGVHLLSLALSDTFLTWAAKFSITWLPT